MRIVLTILCVLLVATAAWGAKPAGEANGAINRVDCEFGYVAWTWDFAAGDQGFTTGTCDTEGVPVWAWGTESTEFAATDVWGTVLNGDYPVQAGEALISPIWLVDGSNYLVQVLHYYDTETSFDGGNLMVNGTVVVPTDGYPDDELCDSDSYYAWCVDGQPGFTDGPSGWITSCFDLSEFAGQEVALEFQFGTDSSVTYPGWYLGAVTVGGDVVAEEGQSWTTVKGLFK